MHTLVSREKTKKWSPAQTHFLASLHFTTSPPSAGDVYLKSAESRLDLGEVAGSKPGVAVVLGAGNQEFLCIVDVLQTLCVHGKVVFIKHHPLRAHLEPVYRLLLAPFFEAGFVDSATDAGVAAAAAAVRHPLVNHIHVTGGGGTHDAIVWGVGEEAKKRREENSPLLPEGVEFTTELGCVSPWIVVPGGVGNDGEKGGEWDDAAVDRYAKLLSQWVKANASANCLSPKVLGEYTAPVMRSCVLSPCAMSSILSIRAHSSEHFLPFFSS